MSFAERPVKCRSLNAFNVSDLFADASPPCCALVSKASECHSSQCKLISGFKIIADVMNCSVRAVVLFVGVALRSVLERIDDLRLLRKL